ncbi:MAG TPA: hypothetical protein VF335_01170 [Chitinivibrionales bacterium]
MSLSNEEKAMVEEALQIYLQLVARQMQPAQVQQLALMAQGIIKKLDSAGSVPAGKNGNKPAGITDEWFKKVCQSCNKLTATGCSDKVTEKYPGKCDPIIKYENEKRGLGKAPQKSF